MPNLKSVAVRALYSHVEGNGVVKVTLEAYDWNSRVEGAAVTNWFGKLLRTHVRETGAINRLHFSGAGLWYACVMHIWHRIRLVPDSGADYNTALFQARKGAYPGFL